MIVIPHSADPESWQDAYELVDAVVLMGGPDVAPEAYGAEPHPLTEPGHEGYDVDRARARARRACATASRVLGICRGSQVLNVAAGGTLVQDVPSTGTEMAHMGDWERVLDEPSSHEIEVLEGTRLADWLGAGRLIVNSYHHQAVERLGDGLRAAALSRPTARSRPPSRPTARSPSACSGTTSSTCATTSASRVRCRRSSQPRAPRTTRGARGEAACTATSGGRSGSEPQTSWNLSQAP